MNPQMVFSKDFFEALINNSSDLIAVLTSEGKILYNSRSFCKIYRFTADDLSDYGYINFIDKSDTFKVIRAFWEVKKKENLRREIFFRVINKDGKVLYLEGSFKNLLHNNTVAGVVVNLENVTSKVLEERKTKTLLDVLNKSTVGIAIANTEGIIEYANLCYSEITGFHIDDIIGTNKTLTQADKSSLKAYKALHKINNFSERWSNVSLNSNNKNVEYWESSTIVPIYNSNNVLKRFLIVKENVTEKRIAEDIIKRSNDFYLNLLEESSIMMWRSNTENVRIFFNKAWLNFRGKKLKEEKESKWFAGVHKDDLKDYRNILNKAAKEKTTFLFTYRLLNKRNEYCYIEEFGKPNYDIEGNFVGFIGTCVEKIQGRKVTQTIKEARETLEQSEKIKTEFLAQISHEIRTPINAILSFTSLLQFELADKIEDDLKESFKIIDRGGRRLIRTVDLLLHMSEMQIGSYETSKKQLNLITVLHDVIIELTPQANAKGLKINFKTDMKAPIIYADKDSVIRIFENIVDNAIKYSDKKEDIEIKIYKRANDFICVDVSDKGVGISKDFMPNLFAPFTQEETGYTRTFEGNGLGLSLVKKYCEINNALITVNSEKYIGTTITITFPNTYAI